MGIRRNNLISTFLMKCFLFMIELICKCEMIPKHMTCYLKNPWGCPGVLCSNHSQTNYSLFLLSASIRFQLPLWAGVDISGGEREAITSGPPFFQRFRGYTLREFCTEFLPGFFQTLIEFILKWPNTLSQVGHNVIKGRVVNTAFKSFNTVATCNLDAGVELNARFTTNGMCAKNNTIYMQREQSILEWSHRVNSIVTCCHSAKLCAQAARVFWSQQYYGKTNDWKAYAKKQVFALFS